MRRKDKLIDDRSEIVDIISSNTICRIALSDGSNPYLVPLNYGYRNNKLYMHAAKEGRKLDIIKINNKVCFEITDSVEVVSAEKACSFSSKYRCVIGFGRVNLLTDARKKIEALNVIMAQQTKKDSWDFIESQVAKVIILEIEIDSMTGKKSL